MPAGIEIRNDGGNLQIDGEIRNLMLGGKWSGATTASLQFTTTGGTPLQRILTPSFASDCPVLAVRCDSPIANMGAVRDQPNGTASYEFLVYSTTPVPITFYAFELQKSANSGCGLQVFDGAGQLVFDAAQKQFRVESYIVSGGGVHNLPAGKTYAMVLSDLCGSFTQPSPPSQPWPLHTIFARNAGSAVAVEQITHHCPPTWAGASQGFYSGALQAVVIDVTNY